jgi:cysteine-rich repeat protein
VHVIRRSFRGAVIRGSLDRPHASSVGPSEMQRLTTLRLTVLTLALAASNVLAGCADEETCAEGDLVACTCADGRAGVVLCERQDELGACTCELPDGGLPFDAGVHPDASTPDAEVLAACPNGAVESPEDCDDGNLRDGDGCTVDCRFEDGYDCRGNPSRCFPRCGDGKLLGDEQCDDGNTIAGDGCSTACVPEPGYACGGIPSTCGTVCGDGVVAGVELCDDGNTSDGDGCSAACEDESGWRCSGTRPTMCVPVCGDGIVRGVEQCDDGNTLSGDGCGTLCNPESGWSCAGEPNICTPVCGDRRVLGDEPCDDGNTIEGDGCSLTCAIEAGWSCQPGAPSVCSPICSDGVVSGRETCDDGNLLAGDGCAANCRRERGWECSGQPSTCAATCGDGILAGAEACDDANTGDGDGCDALCAVETGWHCGPNAPSLCSTNCGDGILVGAEHCDDGNNNSLDGCGMSCTVENGWVCDGASPTICRSHWSATPAAGEPSPRFGHTAVWTGTSYVVWGGRAPGSLVGLGTGARLEPDATTWTAISTIDAPAARHGHTATWTGSEMIVIGGASSAAESINLGGRYDPLLDVWSPISSSTTAFEPARTAGHTAVFTGTEVIVWGGLDAETGLFVSTGARLDVATGLWTPTSTIGAPSPRDGHVAAWTGTSMIVWGGFDGTDVLDEGASYDPVADVWAPISASPLGARQRSAAVWIGTDLFVYGGATASGATFGGGARYEPVSDTWLPVALAGAPSERVFATAVWTGTDVIVWGGTNAIDAGTFLPSGATWSAATDAWRGLAAVGAPTARAEHTAAWSGSAMILWGGRSSSAFALSTGAVYRP